MEQPSFPGDSCQSTSIGSLDDHFSKLVIDSKQFIDPYSPMEAGISAFATSAATSKWLCGHLPAIREISTLRPPRQPALVADSPDKPLSQHTFDGA
jgi:hypothetical protein